MKIDFSATLYDIKGNELKEATDDGREPEDLTLGAVAVGALLAQENGVEGKEKFKRWELARSIQDGLDKGEPVDLNAAEVAKIRKQIGKLYGPIVVGQSWKILDQRDLPSGG